MQPLNIRIDFLRLNLFRAIPMKRSDDLLLQGVNAPLQQRVNILNLDLIQTNEDLNNCETYQNCTMIDLGIFFC